MANAAVPIPSGMIVANQASRQRMNDYCQNAALESEHTGLSGTPHVVPPQCPPSQTRGNQPSLVRWFDLQDINRDRSFTLMRALGTVNGAALQSKCLMGTPLMHAAYRPGTRPVQQKRPPSRSMGTPCQQPQQVGPMTPRPQPTLYRPRLALQHCSLMKVLQCTSVGWSWDQCS